MIHINIPVHKLTTTNLTEVPENRVFFDGGSMDRNPPIHPQLPHVEKNPKKQVTVLPVSTFDTPQSCLHQSTKGMVKEISHPSDIILVPRIAALTHTGILNKIKPCVSLCDALDDVERSMRSSHKR